MRLDPYYSQTMVAQMDTIGSNIQNLTTELSSGVSVNSISDDPSAAAEDLLLRGQGAEDAQFVQSAGESESKLQMADSVLGNVVSQVTSAISLATQGLSGTENSGDLATIGQQLAGIRDEVLGLANTSYLGEYLFSGSQVNTQPFTLDTSTSPATVTYHGDADAVAQQTPTGQSVQTGYPGQALFGSGTGVLSALNQIVADFSGSSLPSSAQSDASALTTALNGLTTARAGVDTSITRLEAAGTYSQNEETQLASSENTLVQADYTDVSTELKNAETQQTALFDVMSTVNQNSLFNYLRD